MTSHRSFTHGLALMALVFAAGCGADGPSSSSVPEPDPTVDPPTGAWTLVAAEIDGETVGLPTDVSATMVFDGDRVGGSNGCNSYGATMSIADDGTVTVGPIESTLMGCFGERAELERVFMEGLRTADRFERPDDRTLLMISTSSTWTFERDDAEEPTTTPEGNWVVDRFVVDGSEYRPDDAWPVTLNIADGRLGGTAACNSYGGTHADGGRPDGFVVGELSWTEMGCAPEVMEIEQAFLRALQEIERFTATPSSLRLASADDGTVIELAAVEPVADASLAGTVWRLDTYIAGEAATNSAAMDTAFLEFGADGTLTGSTGCRRLEGEWQLEGATLLVPILAALDDPAACSADAQLLDGQVISVIESGVRVDIDGTRLTLTAPGGEGLSFRADDG